MASRRTLLATPYKHAFLEKIFLDICTQLNTRELDELKALVKQADTGSTPGKSHDTPKSAPVRASAPRTVSAVPAAPKPTPPPPPAPPKHAASAPSSASGSWQAVCQGIAQHNDPILLSIFQQAAVQNIDTSQQTITVKLASTSAFFKEKVNDAQQVWQPLVQQHFNCTTLVLTGATAPPATPQITRDPIPIPDRAPLPSTPAPGASPWQQRAAQKRPKLAGRPKGTPLLITEENKSKWPQAELLLTHFPGKLELLGDVQ